MKYYYLLFFFFLAACATGGKHGIHYQSIPAEWPGVSSSFRSVLLNESKATRTLAATVDAEMQRKGYVLDETNPDFLIHVVVKGRAQANLKPGFGTIDSEPHPRLHLSPIGEVENLWTVYIDLINPATGRRFIESSSSLSTPSTDVSEQVDEMAKPLLRKIPDRAPAR